MRTDFMNLENGAEITLYPLEGNPLHKKPVKAIYMPPYFYCTESEPEEGPDYYLGDILTYIKGFTVEGGQ